jgi:hypothetical protein
MLFLVMNKNVIRNIIQRSSTITTCWDSVGYASLQVQCDTCILWVHGPCANLTKKRMKVSLLVYKILRYKQAEIF